MLFPAVRRAAPHLAATIDQLEADHRAVSDLLDRIEATAHDLGNDDAARGRLVEALETLTTHLHDHLAFEERSLAPVLRTWTRWPHPGQLDDDDDPPASGTPEESK
ncbi:hemerythrin domain-containing protein [Micromonospora sp. CPCC 205371]|nr:hemerythrin domain-containing protein [Micromonospora sp. CPCC 205371]